MQEELGGLRAVDFVADEPLGPGELSGPGELPGPAEQDGPGTGPAGQGDADPLGERLVARFLEFLRALAAAREGATAKDRGAPCRVTVVTRRAVFGIGAPAAGAAAAAAAGDAGSAAGAGDVGDVGGGGDVGSPRAATLWGAVRALGHELVRGCA